MKKIPISGGPHTGKTTLFEALKKEFPKAYFVPEPAEIVIQRQRDKQKLDSNYKGIFPVTNYQAFMPLVIEESLKLEAIIPLETKIVFQDRCLIDNIGYACLNQC